MKGAYAESRKMIEELTRQFRSVATTSAAAGGGGGGVVVGGGGSGMGEPAAEGPFAAGLVKEIVKLQENIAAGARKHTEEVGRLQRALEQARQQVQMAESSTTRANTEILNLREQIEDMQAGSTNLPIFANPGSLPAQPQGG